ncbi:hypothetical protein NEOLEDRAFT_192256 [Neolentinus lepideus HHB14362 ss-1]|uniref:Uncharacterized protein n=1 Tax=Neolentinus lepideus HHB14362 ss-1 TaxID=1314782 RepID=A0A165MG92_9AGAM|nr:hypothetical protein NEOLEDRAFT_192256 [Neolentinus lepideus HHB14362 ss-1]
MWRLDGVFGLSTLAFPTSSSVPPCASGSRPPTCDGGDAADTRWRRRRRHAMEETPADTRALRFGLAAAVWPSKLAPTQMQAANGGSCFVAILVSLRSTSTTLCGRRVRALCGRRVRVLCRRRVRFLCRRRVRVFAVGGYEFLRSAGTPLCGRRVRLFAVSGYASLRSADTPLCRRRVRLFAVDEYAHRIPACWRSRPQSLPPRSTSGLLVYLLRLVLLVLSYCARFCWRSRTALGFVGALVLRSVLGTSSMVLFGGRNVASRWGLIWYSSLRPRKPT